MLPHHRQSKGTLRSVVGIIRELLNIHGVCRDGGRANGRDFSGFPKDLLDLRTESVVLFPLVELSVEDKPRVPLVVKSLV